MRSPRIIAYVVSVLAVISSVAAFFLPLEPVVKGSLAVALMVAETHTGAAIIYLMSFKKFTRKLKVAYGLICAASILAALGTAQLLAVSAFNLRSAPWVEYGGTELPFLIGLFVLYVGYSLFGTLLGMRTVGKTPWIVAAVASALALGSAFVPHVPKLDPETAVNISIAFSTAQVVCLLSGVNLLVILKRRAGPLYTPALAWMLLSLASAAMAATLHLWQYIFLPDDHWFVVHRLFSIFLGVSGVCSLKAALAFATIPSATGLSAYQGKLSFFGEPKTPRNTQFTDVDIITFTANLASNVRTLDPLLDSVRYITSKTSPQNLSAADKATLAKVYIGIEDFLINKEPVRKYTREELRHIVESRFDLRQSHFWNFVNATRARPPATAAKLADIPPTPTSRLTN